MITSVLGSREDARIPSGEAGGEASDDAWIPWGGKHAQCCACFPPLTMTDASQVVVGSSRRITTKRPEKVEEFVETTANTLEAAVECALWRSAGLDRALKIDPTRKTLQNFLGAWLRDSQQSTKKGPKMAEFSLRPAIRYPDTRRGEAPEPRK